MKDEKGAWPPTEEKRPPEVICANLLSGGENFLRNPSRRHERDRGESEGRRRGDAQGRLEEGPSAVGGYTLVNIAGIKPGDMRAINVGFL